MNTACLVPDQSKVISLIFWLFIGFYLIVLASSDALSQSNYPDYGDLTNAELLDKASAGDAHAYYSLGHNLLVNEEDGSYHNEHIKSYIVNLEVQWCHTLFRRFWRRSESKTSQESIVTRDKARIGNCRTKFRCSFHRCK